MLTVKRGTDTLSATTSVAVVEGVASGWTLLDNFDTYQPGNLFGNGYWNDTSGNSAQVLTAQRQPGGPHGQRRQLAYLAAKPVGG